MSPRVRSIVVRAALCAGLIVTFFGLYAGRRALIRHFFVDGAVLGDTPVWPHAPVGEGLRPVPRVRVVLLDGLSRAHAMRLPQLSKLCRAGQELELDTGFPTVSLPVQSVLWTGLTQQQSGYQYHIGRLPEPPPRSIPAQVDSVAVAESHPEIVHSFGFARALPPVQAAPPAPPLISEWRADDFILAAHAAVVSPTHLAFIHVLRIDDAGHAEGGASLRYAAAAAWSDALLGILHAASPADPNTLWVILADHGHRAAGGHGGPEPEIRLVRACLLGGDITPGPLAAIHLIDLARALADALAADLPRAAVDRPWTAALLEPARGASLPRPGLARWLLAAGLLLMMLLSLRAGPPRLLLKRLAGERLPWPPLPLGGPPWLPLALGLGWPALALLGVAFHCGWPSMSNPAVYPPAGQDLLYAGAYGLLPMVILAGTASVRWECSDGALLRAVLLPWALILATTLLLSRVPDALVLGTPPLMPWTTGLTSTLMVHGRAACLLLAILMPALTLRDLWRARRPHRPANPTPRPPGADLA